MTTVAPSQPEHDRIFRSRGEFPTRISEKSARLSFAPSGMRWDHFCVADSERNLTLPFRATEHLSIVGAEHRNIANSTHKVLVTLQTGGKAYRVVADLVVRGGTTELRLYRFDAPNSDEWFAERKIVIPVARPEIAPLEHPIKGIEFALSGPIVLDEATAAELFGPTGPLPT
jgi:hypothetical protein